MVGKESIRSQIEVVGCQVLGRFGLCAQDFSLPDLRFDDGDDAGRDSILQIEDGIQCTLVTVRPYVTARRRIDELPRNAQSASSLAHRSFKHIAHAEFAPNLANIDGAASVGK